MNILNALTGMALPLPIGGDGLPVRDWRYVSDHCPAVRRVLESGRPGETYNVGGRNEMSNLARVHVLRDTPDRLAPKAGPGAGCRVQIVHVKARPGHDRCYATAAGKIECELGRKPAETVQSCIVKTVQRFLASQARVAEMQSATSASWVAQQ